MRIVAVGDTHNRHDVVDVPDGDVFLFAGDMCGRGTEDEVRAFGEFVDDLPHEHKVIVAGNHDWPFERQDNPEELLPDCIYLEDEAVTIDGYTIYGSPWQPEFCNWAFNLPRGDKLAEKWEMIPEDTDVLATHGPPYGKLDKAPRRRSLPNRSGSTSFWKRVGCRELKKRVKEVEPLLHVFGHIHEGSGIATDDNTIYSNVSYAGAGDAPNVFDLDDIEVDVVSGR